jgi:predicted house-cleaning noncanonical NTP pyrophosphatase (MazG superfamily)
MEKLVRDRIPEIMEKKGQKPIVRIANKNEYADLLARKLQEEVDEFIEKPSAEELADILEVIDAIAENMKISKDGFESIRKKKAEERGGFRKKLVLRM